MEVLDMVGQHIECRVRLALIEWQSSSTSPEGNNSLTVKYERTSRPSLQSFSARWSPPKPGNQACFTEEANPLIYIKTDKNNK
ncbi:hypothetical protein RvY_02624 [Ramazzottius varieornatus]|uniref:Uncharacterized protein n=1 Tax=Ramazzottius varieornatus TaxID=947166 RepID=A0A1D1USE6_RAMVA|nr:hypothetical protein RvY_02624 [Ramazzottius varieornatus]